MGLGMMFHQAFLDRDLSQGHFLRQQDEREKPLFDHLHRQNLLVVAHVDSRLQRHHQRQHHQQKLLLKNLNRCHYLLCRRKENPNNPRSRHRLLQLHILELKLVKQLREMFLKEMRYNILKRYLGILYNLHLHRHRHLRDLHRRLLQRLLNNLRYLNLPGFLPLKHKKYQVL
jgi:hypothetical protein